MRSSSALLFVALAVGCTSIAEMSSGHVGCPPEEVVISNKKDKWGSSTWTAQCRGVDWYCTSLAAGEGGAPSISCAREGAGGPPGGASAVPEPAPAATGCQYDTQCKGDRICQAGQCVDVAAPSTETTPPPSEPATDAS